MAVARSLQSLDGNDGGGDEEDTGGDSRGGNTTSMRNRRRHQVSMATPRKFLALMVFVLFYNAKSTAGLSTNLTFKGEQRIDISVRIGQTASLPCEMEPSSAKIGAGSIFKCGTVHSVKWYRGSNRIYLYSDSTGLTQPRKGFNARTFWSTDPNSTLSHLVMENITAADEAVYKCEITYTAVHEHCNIVQFINVTTYIEPEWVSIGTYSETDDSSAHNSIDSFSSDFDDNSESDIKFGTMKKLTSGSLVGPIDEGSKIRLVCRAGRGKPVPQVTWFQHNHGQISDSDLVEYKARKVDSVMSSNGTVEYTGLWVGQSVLTIVGRRGASGRYECRVKTVIDVSPTLTSSVELTVNVRPLSVEMSTSSSGSTVTAISSADNLQKSQNGDGSKNTEDVVFAETTEGEPLVVRCAARGARPQANVTWYYYYKDQDEIAGNDDYGLNTRPSSQPSKSLTHGAPVVLGNSQSNAGSNAGSANDYLVSEQRRLAGTEIIGPVEIAQHTEYQVDGTRDTHSQLSMSQLHRQQDGSILRCDAYNNVGSLPIQPLTVNMTIRVKYIPTAWVVPITDGENSGAIVEGEIKDGTDNGPRYQTNLFTVVVNETKDLRLQCAYNSNPNKLRTPVKWYRDGNELQLVDEDESSSSHGSSSNTYSMNGAGVRYGMNNANLPKYVRTKRSGSSNGSSREDNINTESTVLLVRKVTRLDSGRYECRVRNSVGAANSTNFANVRVQYTPKVKLHVILEDSYDENQNSSKTNVNMDGSNPIVIESQHRNVTLRCAVELEQDQQNIEDPNNDPSLNLTVVHWFWNGVRMQLPNCTKSADSNDFSSDMSTDEDEDSDYESTSENENNGMNDYFSETHGDKEYESYADNDTRKRNKKQKQVTCTERELILVNVRKNIHGNYSCRARNAAGLRTQMSEQTPLTVYFAPGPVTLEFSPRRLIKGRNVTLRCNAQYLGRPQHPTEYSWFRNGQHFTPPDQTSSNSNSGANGNNDGGNNNPELFVNHVSVYTRANYTCSAFNKGGTTFSEPVYIEVYAPPNYITGPPQYLGVVFNATHVNASCTIECYPQCTVSWLRRGIPIDPFNNPVDKERYSILTEYLPAEQFKNDFEAVRSTLIWRMDNWPGGRGLDPITDSTDYSCRSSGNEVGPPVPESIMNFSVEYPPGNLTVSKTVVQVNEGNIPEKVFCHADGRPQPTFEWRYMATTNAISSGNSSQSSQSSSQKSIGSGGNGGSSGSVSGQINNQQLVLNSAVSRQQAGYYACIANNTHGNNTVYTYLDVMYKPSCELRMLTVDQLKKETASTYGQFSGSVSPSSLTELDEFLSSAAGDKRILVCTATANPGSVQYTWTIRDSGRQNDTTTSPPSSTADSPATERIITVSIGSSASIGSFETDNIGGYNRSVLILQDRLEVSTSDDGDGRGSDNRQNDGATEGVRTYVCTVNNTVGWDQCSIQVQGDAPWWKQFLVTIGLGGWPVMFVLVALVVIVLLIVILVIVLILLFVCKNRFIKPGGGGIGGRQKYVKQKYPTLTAYRVPVVWRRHRSRGLLLNISKVRQNPEGSATSVSGVNPANPQCTDQLTNDDTPKPPPGYGDDLGSLAESFSTQQTTSPTAAVGKWPLKPGVLVHSKQQLLKPPQSTVSPIPNELDTSSGSVDKMVSNDKLKSKKANSSSKIKSMAESMTLTNETQSERAARIRRMMIGSNNNLSKKPSPTSPPPAPPIREKLDNSANNIGGKYPSVTDSRSGAGQQQDNESNLGTTGDSKAAFYENLPFHGMRPPPNQKTQPSNRENVSNDSRKPPFPLPPPPPPPRETDASPSSSQQSLLIHRPADGGYVSLLRRAISTLAADGDNNAAAVRFNSLQRPSGRDSMNASSRRRNSQFWSMRTGDKNGTRCRPAAKTGQDKNNNNGWPAKGTTASERHEKGEEKRGGGGDDDDADVDERKDVLGSMAMTGCGATLPKPAPRTHVPSKHGDAYENLLRLSNGDDNAIRSSKKLTGIGGIGARSLDEFYRMQIQQQQQLLYHRTTVDDAVTAAGYSTAGTTRPSVGGVQQCRQQSIEMTQFDTAAIKHASRVDGGGPNGRFATTGGNNGRYVANTVVDDYDDDDEDDSGNDDGGGGRTIKSMTAGGNARRRRRGQPVGGTSTLSATDHYNGGSVHHVGTAQHNNRRRGDRMASSVASLQQSTTVSNANNNNSNNSHTLSGYNTIVGGGGGGSNYYVGDVYGSGSVGVQRQQQQSVLTSKRQQRPYYGGVSGSVGNVTEQQQQLTAKRSWRRQQHNRRRRAGSALADGDNVVDDYAADGVSDEYRTVATLDRHHLQHRGPPPPPAPAPHHQQSQKNGDRVPSATAASTITTATGEQQPYKPASGYMEGDMEYADVDYRTMYYGPINYKQSSSS